MDSKKKLYDYLRQKSGMPFEDQNAVDERMQRASQLRDIGSLTDSLSRSASSMGAVGGKSPAMNSGLNKLGKDLYTTEMAQVERMPRQEIPQEYLSKLDPNQDLKRQMLEQSLLKKKAETDAIRNKMLPEESLPKGFEPAKSKTSSKMSEGQKVLDRQWAKDHNEWTSGGSDMAMTEIQKLRAVAKDLKEKRVETGGFTGMFPDQLTSNKVLSARADVESSINQSLKQIMGAQFTEREGARVIKATWNEADSTENNLKRIERLANDLESQARAKTQKANYFEQYGTLQGWKSEQPMTKDVKPEIQNTSVPEKIKVVNSDGESYMIDKSDLEDALADGFEVQDE